MLLTRGLYCGEGQNFRRANSGLCYVRVFFRHGKPTETAFWRRVTIPVLKKAE